MLCKKVVCNNLSLEPLVLVDKQICFEIHHYLQNKFYVRKNYVFIRLFNYFFSQFQPILTDI